MVWRGQVWLLRKDKVIIRHIRHSQRLDGFGFINFIRLFILSWKLKYRGNAHLLLSVFLYKFPEVTRNDRPQDPGSQGTKKMFQDVSIWWQYFAGCYETH